MTEVSSAPWTEGAALEVRGLRRTYGSHVAVSNLDLTVRTGDVYGFLGPNGAGKTTAMRCMLGLIRRDEGSVRFFGQDESVAARQHIGAIIEIPAFHNWTSAYRNLRWACAYAGIPMSEQKAEIARVLERVGLTDRQGGKVKTYSLGMKQRLGIARALLGKPKLLLLDEPTNGLDPKGMKEIRELIQSLAQDDDITIFISSHLLSEVQAMANRVGIIQRGVLRLEGSISELTQTERLTIRVHSSSPEQLAEGLKKITEISFTLDEDGTALVEPGAVEPAHLNRELVTGGVPISAFIPQAATLEDIFMEATR